MQLSLKQQGEDLLVSGIAPFDLADTLNCGQCFRWNRQEDGSFIGIVNGKRLQLRQTASGLLFYHCSRMQFEELWRDYFALDEDYIAIQQQICEEDSVMQAAVAFAPGIRILRQPPWETLCSFIISQNNNIPRIQGIISRLCENFGQFLPNGDFSFPAPEVLAELTVEDLSPLRSGFRAKYLLDAAQKVCSREVDFERVQTMDYFQARLELMRIYGVGPKVADCVLLYGFHRLEAFPEDVWIKRAMQQLYPQGRPTKWTNYAGIAQQYLFHYIRFENL